MGTTFSTQCASAWPCRVRCALPSAAALGQLASQLADHAPADPLHAVTGLDVEGLLGPVLREGAARGATPGRPLRRGGQRDPPRVLVEEALEHPHRRQVRSEEHTSELQSLMRISYAVFCLKKKK